MKKYLAIIIVIFTSFLVGSCSNKFDKNDTKNIYVQIVLTNNDKINLQLYYDKAPVTVANFIDYAMDGFYEGTIFHRVISDFMIQGGGFSESKKKLTFKETKDPIFGEFSSNGYLGNTISHEPGVISMARSTSYNSATSQFFICAATCDWLDGSYAAFGKVTDEKSLNVVIKLSNVKTTTYDDNDISLENYPTDIIKIKKVKLKNKRF